jgi:hypothetical protein
MPINRVLLHTNPIMQTRDPDRPTHVSHAQSASRKTRRFHTFYLPATLLFILAVLSGYWLKSQLRIEFFEGDTLSRYFPFNYLAPHRVIKPPRSGILLHDSFDSFPLFGNWSPLWMKEQGKVTKTYDAQGIDNSRCLLIDSSSAESWSCSHKNYIQSAPGDTFSFTASVQLHGDKLSAYASVAAFDEKKKAVSWNFISEKIEKTGEWVTVEKSFTIPEGISFLMFKISGAGVGEYRFDNITFSKI